MRGCKHHGEKYLRCMGGRSAHPSNWYCELCETDDEALLAWFGELNDSEINPHGQISSLKFTGEETGNEILRRMKK